MSNKALTWALKMNLKSSVKVVLLVLANYARPDTNKCWPGIERLVENCGLSRKSVIRSLNKLIEYGLISKQPRYSEKGGRTSNMYILNTKSKGIGVKLTHKGGGDSQGGISVTVTHKGGCHGDTLYINNKQDTLENHYLKEKESIKEKEREREDELFKKYAKRVLEYLNKIRPGKLPFQPAATNINLIIDRMKELSDLLDIDSKEAGIFCVKIICHQQREWGTDPDKRKNLRPLTLFNKDKFHQYFGDLPAEDYYE